MLKTLLKYKNSRFVRNVAVVASGTAAAQIISVAFSPVITRLYGPEAFGLLGTFVALTHTLSPVAGLGYQGAIVLPKEDREADGIARLARRSGFVLAGLLGVVLLFFETPIRKAFNLQAIGPFVYLIPLTIVFATFQQISQQWMLRKKLYKSNAKISFLQSLFMNIGKSGIGFFYPSGSVLIVLSTLENALHGFMQSFALKRSSKGVAPAVERVSLRMIAKKYRDFPLYRTPQTLINTASQSLPVLLLAGMFGPAAAGYYSLGRKILNIPTTLIGKSVGNVFYPRLAEAANRGENIAGLLFKATAALALVGVLPFGLIALVGPWSFGIIFGSEWTKAGEYARWISFSMFFVFINRPSLLAMPVLSLQGFLLVYELFSSSFLVAGILVGFYVFSSDVYAVAIFCIVGAIVNILLMVLVFRMAGRWDRKKQE